MDTFERTYKNVPYTVVSFDNKTTGKVAKPGWSFTCAATGHELNDDRYATRAAAEVAAEKDIATWQLGA